MSRLKSSKISNTFLFLASNKMLIIMVGINKMLVRIANTEDPDRFASSALYGPAHEILVLLLYVQKPSTRLKVYILA